MAGQVCRILSLDRPAGPGVAAGERDQVLGALQREHDWLRPVLFHSPYERLLTAEALPGMAANRVGWLRAVARAALDGQLAAPRLAAMAPDDALTELRKLPGIGPAYATLILLRAAGDRLGLAQAALALPG